METTTTTSIESSQPRQQQQDEGSNSAKNKKRAYKRIGNACDNCKLGHLKCDGNPNSCVHCSSQGKICNFSGNKKRGPRPKAETKPTKPHKHKKEKQQPPPAPPPPPPNHRSTSPSTPSSQSTQSSENPSPTMAFSDQVTTTMPTTPTTPTTSGGTLSLFLPGRESVLVKQLVALNERLMAELQQKQQAIEEMETRCDKLQKKSLESSNGVQHPALLRNPSPLIEILRNDTTLLGTVWSWTSAFHTHSKVLWDMVEVPDIDTIRATLSGDESISWTKRMSTNSILANGALICGHQDYATELLKRCTNIMPDDIIGIVDIHLVYGLLVLCRHFLSRIELDRAAYYSVILQRAARSLPECSSRLHLKIETIVLAFQQDIQDRNYTLQRAFVLGKPKGLDLIILYLHYAFNELNRHLAPGEEWTSASLLSYIEEAEEVFNSLPPGARATTTYQFANSVQLFLCANRAGAYLRLQRMDLALMWADKTIYFVLNGNFNKQFLADIIAVCYAMMVHLKVKRMDLVQQSIAVLQKCVDYVPFAARAVEAVLNLLKDPNELDCLDERKGALSFIPEIKQYWNTPFCTQQSSSPSPSSSTMVHLSDIPTMSPATNANLHRFTVSTDPELHRQPLATSGNRPPTKSPSSSPARIYVHPNHSSPSSHIFQSQPICQYYSDYLPSSLPLDSPPQIQNTVTAVPTTATGPALGRSTTTTTTTTTVTAPPSLSHPKPRQQHQPQQQHPLHRKVGDPPLYEEIEQYLLYS